MQALAVGPCPQVPVASSQVPVGRSPHPNAPLAVLHGATQARVIATGADEGGASSPPAPGVPRLGCRDLLCGQAEARVALAVLIALLAIGAAVTRVRFARVGGREGHRRPDRTLRLPGGPRGPGGSVVRRPRSWGAVGSEKRPLNTSSQSWRGSGCRLRRRSRSRRCRWSPNRRRPGRSPGRPHRRRPRSLGSHRAPTV